VNSRQVRRYGLRLAGWGLAGMLALMRSAGWTGCEGQRWLGGALLRLARGLSGTGIEVVAKCLARGQVRRAFPP